MNNEQHKLADAYMWSCGRKPLLGEADKEKFYELIGKRDEQLFEKAEQLAYERESYCAPY